MIRIKTALFFSFVFVLLMTVQASVAFADVWDIYRAESKMFDVDFPGEPEVSVCTMRVDENRTLYSEQMSYAMDIPSMPGEKKHMFIRVDQSWGDPVTFQSKILIELKKAQERYVQHYTQQGARIQKIEDLKRDGYLGKDIQITMMNGDKEMGIRAKIYFSGRTKVQQVVISPVEDIGNYTTMQFFHSLRLYEGEAKEVGFIEDEWKEFLIDEQGLFSVRIPTQCSPYVTSEPKITENGPLRSLTILFYDPVLAKHLQYSVFLYTFENEHITEDILNLYIDQYHVPNPDDKLKDKEFAFGDFTGSYYWYPEVPYFQEPEDFSEIIKAMYVNNYFGKSYILIQEVRGEKAYIQSSIVDNLMASLKLTQQPDAEILYK